MADTAVGGVSIGCLIFLGRVGGGSRLPWYQINELVCSVRRCHPVHDARDEGHPMSEGSNTVRDNGMRYLAGSEVRQESIYVVRDCKK